MQQADNQNGGEPTERQREVLDAALALLVEEGDRVTMTSVARRASCSKETLYKWFGDRDGLLTATVRWQASKVRARDYDRQHLDASAMRDSLESFAVAWLKVITSETSIALNRVAVGHAGSHKSNLGAIVLANGRLSKVAKVGWVALIVILPFAGSIAYLVFGRRASGGGSSSGPQRPTGWFFER